MKILSPILALILFSMGCAQDPPKEKSFVEHPQFGEYWYAGEAELCSYKLEQARYGEIHPGEAVLIFVTEPFSSSKQVKLDRPEENANDKVTVMKLNMTKKFLTGIYPYSMMMSSFVPVSLNTYPDVLKVTASIQEWCGQTFTQLNLKGNKYKGIKYSYFESEGDDDFNISNQWIEDEFWQRIRIDPESLPLGSIEVFPSTFFLRLGHQDAKALNAQASMTTLDSSDFSQNSHKKYAVEYEIRKLNIYFESTFPYKILGWEETYNSGFQNPQELTTRAFLNKSMKSPYWKYHGLNDREIRKQLGLSEAY